MKARLTDEEIIRCYLPNQPRRCFELLYQRHQQQVYRQCLSMTHNAEQARDFAQDIFLKVFQKIQSFQQRSRFSTWLYALTRNHCQDQLRRVNQLPVTRLDEYLDLPLIDATETLTYQDTVRRFTTAMASLSPDEQVLLRLKYEQELSLKDLANLSGLSVSAVKMRLKRSRDKMQRCYIQQLPG